MKYFWSGYKNIKMSSIIYLCNPSVTISYTAISVLSRLCNAQHLKEILQPEQTLFV